MVVGTINLGKSHESTPIWEKSGQVRANEDDLDQLRCNSRQQPGLKGYLSETLRLNVWCKISTFVGDLHFC